MFPEVEKFVEDLRAHYHAIGLARADEHADNYADAVHGMYVLSTDKPAAIEHFDRLLALHRMQIPFEEKRTQLNKVFAEAGGL